MDMLELNSAWHKWEAHQKMFSDVAVLWKNTSCRCSEITWSFSGAAWFNCQVPAVILQTLSGRSLTTNYLLQVLSGKDSPVRCAWLFFFWAKFSFLGGHRGTQSMKGWLSTAILMGDFWPIPALGKWHIIWEVIKMKTQKIILTTSFSLWE